MSTLVINAKALLRTLISKSINTAIKKGLLENLNITDYSIQIPPDKNHGDFAVNVALINAKNFKMAPRKFAEILTSNLDLSDTYFKKFEIAGPGFINFFLSQDFYSEVILDVTQKKELYGTSDYGKAKKINVEFVSANPTGPMHIGNARGGALGDGIAALLNAAGFISHKEFYINDAGNQIERFAVSLECRYLQLFKSEDEIPFPEDGYHGEDIKQNAKEFYEKFGDKYLNCDTEERRKALTDFALPRNINALKKDLERYRISYDTWFNESTLHNNGELKETMNIMKEKNLTYEKDGALWYKASEHGGSKDEVLIRANGHPTYFAADIAYHRNKLLLRGFDKSIDIWGADHHGHIERLRGALNAISLDGSRFQVVLMQLVKLIKDGETVRISKRTGKAITLSTLLDEIPVDAARFFFNMREPNSQMEFDLNLAASQSSQNPVYYVQYAHARICSIIRALEEENIKIRKCTVAELNQLSSPEETALIKHISTLTEEIIKSAVNYDPSNITHYIYELATLFHKFYNSHRVKGEEKSLLQARLNLCYATKTVLSNVLTILKIDAPEKM